MPGSAHSRVSLDGPVLAAYRRLLLLLVSFVDRGIGSVVLLLPALALRLALYTLVLVSGFTRSLALLLGGALGLISLLSLLLSARVVQMRIALERSDFLTGNAQ